MSNQETHIIASLSSTLTKNLNENHVDPIENETINMDFIGRTYEKRIKKSNSHGNRRAQQQRRKQRHIDENIDRLQQSTEHIQDIDLNSRIDVKNDAIGCEAQYYLVFLHYIRLFAISIIAFVLVCIRKFLLNMLASFTVCTVFFSSNTFISDWPHL